jgi:hypothetical protein
VLELDLILENAFCMEAPDLGGRNEMGTYEEFEILMFCGME